MEKPFMYGMSVSGDLFTDRETETRRLLLNFESGVNSILISPRRIGKTSLVRHVMEQMSQRDDVRVVFLDIYKCRSDYDFYNQFASAVLRATATRAEQMIATARELLLSISPKVTLSPDPTTEFSLSLGLTRASNPPEEILDLPERIAAKRGCRVVVCIDEFQQIGEFPDALAVQKTIRSVWQHQRHVSYCLFGSKRHLMTEMFYQRSMPFYQFGDMFFLGRIPEEKWVPFIVSRFASAGKCITEELALRICQTVQCYSAYVQQLAWNVMAESSQEVTAQSFAAGLEATLSQVAPLFMEQTARLTTYQLNLLRAICAGHHNDFGRQEVASVFNFGSRSNLVKLRTTLIERELVDTDQDGLVIADPLFEYWFKREMM